MANLTNLDLIKIAAVAECDPRTVRHYLARERTPRAAIRRAIDAAIAGYTPEGPVVPPARLVP